MQIAHIEETVHQLPWLLTKGTRCLSVASKVASLSPLPSYIYYLSDILKYPVTSMNCLKANVGHFCYVFVVAYAQNPRSCSE